MERKTRSGKIPAAPVAPATGKKKGRKKKSEMPEMEVVEYQIPATTRRSTRGRNPESSLSETLEADESCSSILTSDISTAADDSSIVENAPDAAVDSSISQQIDSAEVSQMADEEIPETAEAKPEMKLEASEAIATTSDVVLEQKMNEVTLNDAEKEVLPDDVEMTEVHAVLSLPDEKPMDVAAKVEVEDKLLDIMDFEDDSKFVRRSRRLQSIHTEVPPVKVEETAENHPESVVLPPTVKAETTELDVIQETTVKPAPPVQVIVEHTDERLKRYETIRDNIYSKKSDKKVCKVNKTMKCDCTITEEEVKNGEVGCQYNCINRILYIECGPKCRCGEYCDNQQFQRHNYADCSVFDTKTKGFGIRANQKIPAETFIIEYVGEVLDNKQFEKRAKKYSENKNVHYYFMALKSNAIIDATKRGNISRFINHSCEPNAQTQKWTVNGELRVGFFSIKDIEPGDEITFDYQYQRYGKEAQKCYCDATACRGWIGENPLDEVDEEDVGESPELDDTKPKKTKAKKGRKPKAMLAEQEVKDESGSEGEESFTSEAKATAKKREATRKTALKLKERQEYFDGLEILGEINGLVESGLKNRNHTQRFARLVMRAKNVDARSRLLKILIESDIPCRRLFLDYHGLKLLHTWMTEIKTTVLRDLQLGVELMNVLGLLPITNKTVLRTSKVLDRVEKWKNIDMDKKKTPKDEKKKMSKEEKKQARAEKKKNKTGEQKQEELEAKQEKQTEAVPMVEAIESSQVADDELMSIKLQIKQMALELLEKWEGLQEDFKIPKKQKQEIMIEHEREADNDDWDDDIQRGDVLSHDRYKNRFGDDPAQSGASRSFSAPYKKQFDPMSKQQRRQEFEQRVAQIDTEKRMMIMHEKNCAIFGLNPNTTNPLDVPVQVNRVTGDYNTIDGRIAAPPPNHYQFKYEPLTLSTNPDDYFLPPIDLPEHWRFALDEYGRIYYYHEKIRQPQWEAPIKILPLKVHDESEDDSPDSDESTTETEDSEEEELRELLEMLKRKKNLPPAQQSTTNPLILQSGEEGDEDDLEKKIMNNMMKNPLDQPVKLSQVPQRRQKKKRQGLTSTQFIRPRTEADKLYGRTESKRYKEVKEKLRQKKRRILKGEVGPEDGSSEDDDDIALDDSIDSRRFVDELDILEKSESESIRNKMKKEAEKKAKKPKPVVVVDQAEIKRQFRDEMKKEIAKFLQPYREESCDNGKITNDVDFSSLVHKLTYSVLMKESKHCQTANSMLKATDSVKGKTKEYIKKYMAKFDGSYQRKEDEQDYASILNKL